MWPWASVVFPAKAGTHSSAWSRADMFRQRLRSAVKSPLFCSRQTDKWVPAFAGMTAGGGDAQPYPQTARCTSSTSPRHAHPSTWSFTSPIACMKA